MKPIFLEIPILPEIIIMMSFRMWKIVLDFSAII